MTRITADKIGSSTGPCRLTREVELSTYIVAEEGYCLAVRALDEKEVYNQIETTDGVFETIHAGDVLVGALGERMALKGYSGRIPRRIQVGDVLNVLNMGGIIGQCTSDHPDLGPALRVEVLGAVLTERLGQKLHARLADHALDPVYSLDSSAPLVMVSGTSMNTGKTYACGQIVKALTTRGLRVAAAKLTGASLMRDARVMRENGAIACATFTDAGVVCSTGKDMAPVAKAIIRHLNQFDPDAVVLELGDGFIGYYGVDDLLLDKELQRFTNAHVVAAADLAGAWAADYIFRSRYRIEIASFTGPVTDNNVGKQYIRNTFGTEALNAMRDAEALGDVVARAIAESGSAYTRLSATG